MHHSGLSGILFIYISGKAKEGLGYVQRNIFAYYRTFVCKWTVIAPICTNIEQSMILIEKVFFLRIRICTSWDLFQYLPARKDKVPESDIPNCSTYIPSIQTDTVLDKVQNIYPIPSHPIPSIKNYVYV